MQALLSKNSINCRGNLISLAEPGVMGILNITPDSFFGASRQESLSALLHNTETMLSQGATFLDIGGQSTRPGAERVSSEEELSRVIPAIQAIVKEFPRALISIDTFYASVAEQAIQEGAALVNDISAGDDDPAMFSVLAKLRVPYIMMHKTGNPRNMQNQTSYTDVVLDIASYFSKKLHELTQLGIADVVLDPGFGFGKTLQQNYELLNRLDEFFIFELPVLAGISRKSMVQKVVGTDANGALNGTTAIHMIALMKGAKILRVHDVKEAMECIKIYAALPEEKPL